MTRDIYSLGVLVYELLTGATTFDLERLKTAALDEVMRIIREEEPPKPSTRVSTGNCPASTSVDRCGTEPGKLSSMLRGDLDWLVMKALAKERDRRYQTASDMAADIERYLRGEPIEARPPSSIYALRKMVSRHRSFFAASAATMVTLVAGIIATAHLALGQKEARIVADQKAREAIEQKEVADKAQHKLQRTLASLQDEFMQKAIVAAMSGNRENALAAYTGFEKAGGVSKAWKEMLIGQCDLYIGRMEQAVEHLHLAVDADPGNLAANAMLAVGYNLTDNCAEHMRIMNRTSSWEPKEAVDWPLLAHAHVTIDVDLAYQTMLQMPREFDSPLARLVLADIQTHVGLDTHSSELVDTALRNIYAGKVYVHDSPYAEGIDLFAHSVAIQLRSGDDATRDKLLAEGKALADEPQHFQNNSLWQQVRAIFYADCCGDRQRALQILKEEIEGGEKACSLWAYTALLYEAGETEEAWRLLKEPPQAGDTPHAISTAGVLAFESRGTDE